MSWGKWSSAWMVMRWTPGDERFGLCCENGRAAEVVAVDIDRSVWRNRDDLQPRRLRGDGAAPCAAARDEHQHQGSDSYSHSIVDGGLDEMS